MGAATMMRARRPARAGRAPAEQAAKSIGARLRALRKAQKTTLVELAKSSGVDMATISRIETGKMTGTLECHVRLTTALGVKITDLYAGIEEARTKDAATFQPPSASKEAYVHEVGRYALTMLTTEIMRKKLMPVLLTIEPGGSTHREEARVGTEKFLYLLDGTLEARVGETTHLLRKGSSLYLDASVPHQMKNIGPRSARCLSIVTPPVL